MERSELEAAKRLGVLEDVISRRNRLQTVSIIIASLSSLGSAISSIEISQHAFVGNDGTFVVLAIVLLVNGGYMVRNLRLLKNARNQLLSLNEQLNLPEKIKNDEVQVRLGDDGELIFDEEVKPLQQQVRS